MEAANTDFFIRIRSKLLSDLPKLIVRPINWLQWKQIRWKWRQMSCMLFVDAIIYNMLDPVGCAFQLFNDLPWAGIRLADFPYNTSLLIRLDGPSREDIITNRIDFGIWSR